MNCETVRGQFSLYLYGELTFDEEESLEQHLAGCRECSRKLELEKQIHRSIDITAVAPSQELLERCRLVLPRVILHSSRGVLQTSRDLERRPVWWESLRNFFQPPAGFKTWRKPAGAVALVAIGFFAARLTLPSAAALPHGDGNITRRVRFVEPSDTGIRMVVDETKQRVVTGTLDDESVRQLLLAAVRDPVDPGIRAESLDALKGHSEAEEVRKALLYVVQHDRNAGVRFKALEALKPYAADPESRDALSEVLLNDDNPGVRTMAIDYLTTTREPEVVGALQEAMRKEENSYVRFRCQKALREMKASLQTF